MRKTIFFIAIGILTVHTACSQKKDSVVSLLVSSVKEYPYPASSTPILGFSILDDGMILLPLRGGIFLPEWYTWYLQTKKNIIQSASPCTIDTSLLLTLSTDKEVKIISLKKLPDSTESMKVMRILPKGFYDIHAIDTTTFYYWGIDTTGFNVWVSQNDTVSSLFNSVKPITAFSVLSKSSFLIACDQKIILMEAGKQPLEIVSFKDVIDGLAMDDCGNLFFSSRLGVFEIDPSKQINLIVPEIHGKLIYWDKRLYVLYQEKNKVIKILLK